MRNNNVPVLLDGLFGNDLPTFGNLAQWYELGGRCVRCEREGWVDRWELEKRFGPDRCYIPQLEPLLRCKGCGNKKTNRWIVRKAAR